ncbi:MAG: hypothetical protein ACOC2U_01010 [bacterium]
MRQQRIKNLTFIIVTLLIIMQLLGGISLLDSYFDHEISSHDFKIFYEKYLIRIKLWQFLEDYLIYGLHNKIAKIVCVPLIIGLGYLLRIRFLSDDYKNFFSLVLLVLLVFEIVLAISHFIFMPFMSGVVPNLS